MSKIRLTLGSDAYQKIRYPAGELQIRLTEETIERLKTASELALLARITNAEQIIELCLLWDALLQELSHPIPATLLLPYLPYARADRRFVPGDCFGLGIFSGILRTLGARVVSLDAHSRRSRELVDGLINVSALPLVAEAISRFAATNECNQITVLFPDEGARQRYSLPSTIGTATIQVLNCSKRRNPMTSKLLGFTVPELTHFAQGSGGRPYPVLIVDDICDGGGTFIGIADALREYGLSLGLYVTHGIFSKGFAPLESRFQRIYTTDSFYPWQDQGKLTVLAGVSFLLEQSNVLGSGDACALSLDGEETKLSSAEIISAAKQ